MLKTKPNEIVKNLKKLLNGQLFWYGKSIKNVKLYSQNNCFYQISPIRKLW